RAVLAAVLPYGKEGWWSGDLEEVMIGAVLTQQTRWENVERGLMRMKEAGVACMAGIARCEDGTLEEAIRCTGFYRVKARRLRALACHVLQRPRGLEGMAAESTVLLQEELLGIAGVGEETAACILCYGFGRMVFVMDAYTQRICGCAGIHVRKDTLHDHITQELQESAACYRMAHAGFVEYGRRFCHSRRCPECRFRRSSV
ncbi:MAG: Fe-S cluster assembly protein HesB, partial [Methanomicrobiales archaeon]|nr:Fe-S cluster assembly protein HesB [Methanomicrobiales archaeon]